MRRFGQTSASFGGEEAAPAPQTPDRVERHGANVCRY
jgi:hypothetical protein